MKRILFIILLLLFTLPCLGAEDERGRPTETYISYSDDADEFMWERIFNAYGELQWCTQRAEVIGGWVLYYGGAMVFIPDPEHKWRVK